VTPRATLQAELTGMAEKRDARASVAFRLRGYAILGKVERHAAF